MGIGLPLSYLWALAAPPACCLVGWRLILRRDKTSLYAGCCLIYWSIWLLAVMILWVGVVLAFAGWVWPMVFEPEKSAPAVEKVLSAIAAWILVFMGNKLLALRQLHVPSAILKWLIQASLKRRVPATLPIDNQANAADRLAYRAMHEEQFAATGVAAITGWGIGASCRRLELINRP